MLCELFSLNGTTDQQLPMEVVLIVLSLLDEVDLNSISQASKTLNFLCSDEMLWQRLYFKRWAVYEEKLPRKVTDKPLSKKEQRVQLKDIQKSCCWKHQYQLRHVEETEAARKAKERTNCGTIEAGAVRKGDIVILKGQCCRIVEVQMAK